MFYRTPARRLSRFQDETGPGRRRGGKAAIRRIRLLVFLSLGASISSLRAASLDRRTLGEGDFPAISAGDIERAGPAFLSLARFSEDMGHVPAGVSVVGSEEIRRMGAKTAADVLERLPSVQMTKSGTLGGYRSLRLRGAPSASHVQILIDDLPLGGVAAQAVDLSQIPAEDIDRIEVVRGGAAVLYGANTTGGVVHVVTRRHAEERPVSTVGVEGSSFKTQIYRGSLGARGRGFDGRVNGSHYTTDGFQKNADGTNTSVSGAGGYTFSGGGRVSMSLARYDSDIGDPQGTLLPLSEWDGSRERDPVDRSTRIGQNMDLGRVRAVLPVGNLGQAHAVVYGADRIYKILPARGRGASFHQRTQIVGTDARLLFPFGLLLGASYERDRRETLGASREHVVDWGAYVQQSLALGDLSLVPAVRMDQHSVFGNTYNPRLTIVHRTAERLKLSANAARSFRAPSFQELFDRSPSPSGNGSLRPEVAWTYDAGAEWKTSARSSLSVTGFFTRLRDRIFAGAAAYVNAPRAEQSGFEAEWAGRAGAFAGRVNYTFTRAVGNSLASSRYAPLGLTPRHLANADLTWDASKKWSLTNRLRYVDRQFQFDGEGGVELPPFAVWDLRLTRRILGAELYFGVENAADRRYAEGFGTDPAGFASTRMPQPRRTFFGGIDIRFVD